MSPEILQANAVKHYHTPCSGNGRDVQKVTLYSLGGRDYVLLWGQVVEVRWDSDLGCYR